MLQTKARCIYCGGELRFGMKTHYERGNDVPQVRYFYECAECGARTMGTEGRKQAESVADAAWEIADCVPMVFDVRKSE
jgi:hypothetical protein